MNSKIHGNVDISSNDVYYRLYQSERIGGLITVVCMQWFDEMDYYEERFVKTSDGEAHTFETEEMAIEKLNKWYKPEEIDPEYRKDTLKQLVRDDND